MSQMGTTEEESNECRKMLEKGATNGGGKERERDTNLWEEAKVGADERLCVTMETPAEEP